MKDLCELSAEISAVAMMVAGLSNQLDNNQSDILTPEAMQSALFGVWSYLERISADIDAISSENAKKKGEVAA